MIGVIVTLDEDKQAGEGLAVPAADSWINPGAQLVQWDVLGASVLNRFFHSLESIAPRDVALLSDAAIGVAQDRATKAQLFPQYGRYSSWENAAQTFLFEGIQTLLLVKLNHYIDLDLVDLVRFHYATSSKLTQVFLGSQAISVVLVQAAELRGKGVSLRRQLASTIPQRRRYQFSGYYNPLRGLTDFRKLCTDAVTKQCRLAPIGSEIGAGVYADENVSVHPTVSITGPAYLGAHSEVGAGCSISGAFTLERDCEIDCGTSLENCSLTHHTYVGPGLNLRNALAGPGWVYNLEHSTVVAIHDQNLLGSTRGNLLARAKSLLSYPRQARSEAWSTFSPRAASLYSPRRTDELNSSAHGHFNLDHLPSAASEENPSR
jgi:hypothetical protein